MFENVSFFYPLSHSAFEHDMINIRPHKYLSHWARKMIQRADCTT